MNDQYVLAIDPSGSYNEGKGTTGWCLFDMESGKIAKYGEIKASNYTCQFHYWDAHIQLIDSLGGYHPDIVVEDYLLYGTQATCQINSRLETPQLLGIIKYEAWKRGLFIYIQTAMQVKTRWSDSVLAYKKLVNKKGQSYYIKDTLVSDHVRDSIRHAIHYATYNKNKKEKRKNGK